MGFLKGLLSLLVLLAIIAAGAGVAGYLWLGQAVEQDGPLPTATTFEVRPGESLVSVATRLENEGIISDKRALRLHARLEGAETAIKTGEFAVPAGASMAAVLDLLVAGRVIQYTITIPEGLTLAQAARIIESNEDLTGPLPDPLPAEGELLPETYAFSRATSRETIIARMATAQDDLIAELWPTRSADLPLASQDDALILASIVQKESAGQDEYGNVASVFINRLERGMKLETDVSVHYGVNGGEPLYNTRGERRTLYRSELDRDTPYNTYTRTGLPPTPIALPGEGAIRAVLNPPETEYLFFVASGTGGSIFTTNYRDHQRAVADYRAYERAEIARERAN